MRARSGAAPRLLVLTYHRIAERAAAPPGLATPRAAFERQMRWLAGTGRAVSLADVLAAKRGARSLRDDAVLVTFDDAYRDFAQVAWPLLRRLGVPVTLFVPTAYPGDPGRSFWWDALFAAVHQGEGAVRVEGRELPLDSARARRSAYRRLRDEILDLPHDQAMARAEEVAAALGAPRSDAGVLSWADLRRLAAEGVTLAPHTRTHPRLDRLPRERLADEIGGAVEDLVRETGGAAPALAYPAGGVSPATVRAAADAGIELGFTTSRGVNRPEDADWLALARINVGGRTSPAVLRAAVASPAARLLSRGRPAAAVAPTAPDLRPAVGYVMSRFPKISETFIATEILALEERGVRVEIYPLLREREPLMHPEVRPLVARARYTPFVSAAVASSQLHWLRRRPRAYVAALADLARATAGSANFLGGGLAVFPKVAHIARLMERDGVVHVHCHFANHPAAAGFVIQRLTGLPYSFTAHGADLHKERRMLREKVREATFVATVSEYNRRMILAECGEDAGGKVHILRAGVDTGLFAPNGRRPGDADGAPLAILCVGTLQEVKGQAHLIEACALLAATGRAFHCRLVGEGPDRAALAARIAAAGLEGRVELVGARTRPEVAAELRHADVFVAPSVPTSEGKREGIPVVLMEAMATGLPVVSSRLSGIPELVEDGVNGLLTAPGDAAALARALASLHDDADLRERLGSAARRRVEREFDLDRSADWLVARFGLPEAA
jgi:glycosyltransferase involved in cell wall biosynthesis/peptidoglycan/xylan/chitin deacetylase (PgdA/CDA1 family)